MTRTFRATALPLALLALLLALLIGALVAGQRPRATASVAPTATIRTLVNAPARSNCDPSYPTVCLPPAPPDLDCKTIPYRNFTVRGSDPHGFDSDGDGVGCEN